MQKVKHFPANYMTDLEEHMRQFIKNHNIDVKTMSMTFNPLNNTYHAMIIYEEK